jgi:UDP-2-acetamido-3-amino-2,3-dideoxy-glucuronate N-acetyltransferase
VLLALAVAGVVVHQWPDIRATLRKVEPSWAVAGVLVYYLNYLLRALRLQFLAPPGLKFWPDALWISCFHGTVTYLFPMRSGDLSLPVLLKAHCQGGLLEATRVLVKARVLDVMSLGCITLAAALALPAPVPRVFRMGWVGAGGAMASFPLLLRFLVRFPGWQKFRMFRKLAALGRVSGLQWKEIGLSLGIWLAISGGLYCAARAIHLPIGLGGVLFLVTVQLPLQLLPIQGIANAGNHEGGWVAALSILGIPGEAALRFALASHALLLVYVLAISPVLLLVRISRSGGTPPPDSETGKPVRGFGRIWQHPQPRRQKMTTNKTVAVIGSGYWGKNLVRNYQTIGALGAICDTNETTLDRFREQYPAVPVHLAFSEVLGNSDIDGVVLATPAETHFALAREALLAGKHVYVEKPLVLQEADGRNLIQLASERGRVLMVGHLLQYHPVFLKLRELMGAGELGRINYIYSNRLNLGKIRREENILWSFAPHDISMILALAGEMPETVFATGGNYLHRKIADVTTTHLDFPSGLRAHIFVSWLHPYKEQKLVVVGDRKMAVFDDTRPWAEKLQLYPHQINWEEGIPVPWKAEAEFPAVPEAEPLKMECRHFLHCMATGEQPKTDGREGLQVLRILNASQRSLDRDGERVVLESEATPSPLPADGAVVHPTAVVDDGADIGEGTKVWHFSHILSGSRIGAHCSIGQNVMAGPDVTIGNRCKIQNNVSVYKGVTLEDGVFCGPSMVFTNVFNPRAEIPRMDQVRATLVRRGATIGANATVVCGVTIGRYAFIGAGAVVIRNVPDHALMVGNPARHVGWVCACGERLNDDLTCDHCDRRYGKVAGEANAIRERSGSTGETG